MNQKNVNEFLWVEKYRPETIQECILPANIKKTFLGIVKAGLMPNMLLSGTSGLGKTTVAIALCKSLELDYILINSSEESGIDILRNKIKQFASTISLSGGDKVKVVILDESDSLNPQSTQPALRAFIEEFSSNCRFIFTCNFKNRIIEALHSRCTVIEFNTSKKDLAVLAMEFMKRLKVILKSESIKFDDKTLAELIIKHAPDWRRVLNESQRHSISGEITTNVLVGMSDQTMLSLVAALKDKDFKTMRGWVANNNDIDSSVIFRNIFDQVVEIAKPGSIPSAVIILADYQYKAAFVADRELNTVACLTELMASVEWI